MDRDRLRACSSEDLTRSAGQLAATLAATHAALLEVLAVIDERELWRADGCCSLQDWASFRFGVARKTAHEWVGAARALGELPHLSAAFGSGELSWDKVRAVGELASSDSDEAVTEQAKVTEVKHLERAARKARAVSLAEAESRHRDRFFAMRRSITMGGVRLSGFLPDADGETLIKAIERLAEDVPKDPETGLYPRFDRRCADALVDLASGYLASEQPVHGERTMVVAHVDLPMTVGDASVPSDPGVLIDDSEADADPVRSSGRPASPRRQQPHEICAETASGITLAPETVARMMCDAVVEPAFEHGAGGSESVRKTGHRRSGSAGIWCSVM